MGQNLEEFKKFLNGNKNVVSLLRNVKKENLTKLFEVSGITTKEDLIKIGKNKEVVYLFKNA
jgi:hypothetical protein